MYERSQICIEPEAVADLIPSFFSSVSSFIIALSDSEYDEISAFMALLASEHGKNETAELTGYLSTGHFINVFVSHNNITPLKYRQMRKEKNF